MDTSISNISVMELSRDDLLKEYNSLKQQFISNQQEIERQKQKNYELQRDLTRATALENDYQQELDAVQSGLKSHSEKLENKLHACEEETNQLRENHKEEVQHMEQEIAEKKNEIVKLENELKTVAKLASTSEDCNEQSKLMSENEQLAKEVLDLYNISEELKENLDAIRKEYAECEANLKISQEELETVKANYNCKKEELIEANEMISNQQDELLILKTEIDMIKSTPLDSLSRGNSLFAEVDDRRVQLQSINSKMKNQYLEMKREYVNLMGKLEACQKENKYLANSWEQDVMGRQNDESNNLVLNKNRIATLEDLLERYKKMASVQNKFNGTDMSAGELQFIENMINAKDNEMRKVLDNLNMESLAQISISKELMDSNEQLRQFKAKSMRLECDIAQLKIEMEMLKSDKQPKELSDVVLPPAKCEECRKRNDKTRKFSNINLNRPKPKKFDDKKTDDCIEINIRAILRQEEPKKRSLDNKENTNKILPIIEETEEMSPMKPKTNKGKIVTFSEDTLDAKVTNRKTYRRPGKILECPVSMPDTQRKLE